GRRGARDRRSGRRSVGRRPGRAGQDRRGRPAPAGTQLPQSAGTANQRAHRRRTGAAVGRGALRSGAAPRSPSDPAGRRGAAEQLVPRAAEQGRPRGAGVKTEEELRSLLREAYSMPFGSAQIALVERVIQHADAENYDELRFAARMQATNAYVHG